VNAQVNVNSTLAIQNVVSGQTVHLIVKRNPFGESVQRSAKNLPEIPIVVPQRVLLSVRTDEEKNVVQEELMNVMASQDVVQNILTSFLELESILNRTINENKVNFCKIVFKVESNIVLQFLCIICLLYKISLSITFKELP